MFILVPGSGLGLCLFYIYFIWLYLGIKFFANLFFAINEILFFYHFYCKGKKIFYSFSNK